MDDMMICWQRTWRVPVWTPSAQVEQKLCMGRIKTCGPAINSFTLSISHWKTQAKLLKVSLLALLMQRFLNCMPFLWWELPRPENHATEKWLNPWSETVSRRETFWTWSPPETKILRKLWSRGFLLPVMIHYLKTTESRSMGSMESEGGWRQVSHDPSLQAPKLLLKYWHVFSRNG